MIKSPLSCSARTSPRPHSVCGSHGRSHTAPGSGQRSMRKLPPVFLTFSPVISIENMYRTFLASCGWSFSHWRLPEISSSHRNVSVRSGRGMRPPAMPSRSARASSASVATPLALSFDSRLLHVGGDHDALLRGETAGDLGHKRSHRPGRERAGDGHAYAHRRIRAPAVWGALRSERLSQRRGRVGTGLESETVTSLVIRDRRPTGECPSLRAPSPAHREDPARRGC